MEQAILKKVGLKVGHYTDEESLTGMTCFIAESGMHIGVDIRGSNTGTLDIPAYDPKSAIQLAHAVVLTGGSTFGLESAFGVMQYLEEKSIGSQSRAGVMPGVLGAVIFDLAVGNNKKRPNKENGYHAAQAAIVI